MENGDGYILFANQLFCDCFGITHNPASLINTRFDITSSCGNYFKDAAGFAARVKMDWNRNNQKYWRGTAAQRRKNSFTGLHTYPQPRKIPRPSLDVS